jgi:hypothetical protein
VYNNGLTSKVDLTADYGRGDTYAGWTRKFSLDAHSAVTFSGIGSLGVNGQTLASPVVFDDGTRASSGESFASLTMADAYSKVSLSAIANSLLGGTFSYTTDSTGLMSLTVKNSLDTALTGSFTVGTSVLVSAVPEPATYLSLLLGLGVLGAVARKKNKAPALPSPVAMA